MVFGALRLYYVLTINFADVTATQLPVIIMGTIEPGVAIMVSSSPLLKQVFDAAIRPVLALFGITTGNRDTTVPIASGDAALQTIGGGHFQGRGTKYSRNGIGAASWKRIEPGGQKTGLELTGWPDHKHEVAVTGYSGVKSGNGIDFGKDEETGSEDGILVTTRTMVISETRE